MGTCCDACTCDGPKPQPDVIADPNVIVTEGWQMTGLVSQRKTAVGRRSGMPVLRPIDGPVEWSAHELRNGIAFIEVRAAGDDPDGDSDLRVLGPDPKTVYATWQRVATSVAGGNWFNDEEPF